MHFHAPADKISSRVPRYQKGQEVVGFRDSSVRSALPLATIGTQEAPALERAEGFGEKVEAPHYCKEGVGWLRHSLYEEGVGVDGGIHPMIGGTDGAARGELSSLRLSRVATEVDKVNRWNSESSYCC